MHLDHFEILSKLLTKAYGEGHAAVPLVLF